MKGSAEVSDYTRIYNKFEYHEEDCNCEDCLFFQIQTGSRKRRCIRDVCCCEDIRANAIANGRIKRKRGWNKP